MTGTDDAYRAALLLRDLDRVLHPLPPVGGEDFRVQPTTPGPLPPTGAPGAVPGSASGAPVARAASEWTAGRDRRRADRRRPVVVPWVERAEPGPSEESGRPGPRPADRDGPVVGRSAPRADPPPEPRTDARVVPPRDPPGPPRTRVRFPSPGSPEPPTWLEPLGPPGSSQREASPRGDAPRVDASEPLGADRSLAPGSPPEAIRTRADGLRGGSVPLPRQIPVTGVEPVDRSPAEAPDVSRVEPRLELPAPRTPNLPPAPEAPSTPDALATPAAPGTSPAPKVPGSPTGPGVARLPAPRPAERLPTQPVPPEPTLSDLPALAAEHPGSPPTPSDRPHVPTRLSPPPHGNPVRDAPAPEHIRRPELPPPPPNLVDATAPAVAEEQANDVERVVAVDPIDPVDTDHTVAPPRTRPAARPLRGRGITTELGPDPAPGRLHRRFQDRSLRRLG
ncbi:hypothetical protein GCM10020369_39560 [Cryptosporangium minutisporangium]|uniref:Basic proline-rich protein n=1 Tax=Cryptosporangium minutisporangium TaxID=113569 RepID=A0ABP6T177_9ACTN